MSTFVCPLPAALTSLTAIACAEKWGQISKMAFQRAGTPFANLTAIKTLATWTPLLTETDDTKITITPFFANMVIPASEEQTFGGNSNETINGIPVYLGEGFVKVTGTFRGLTAAQKIQLQSYSSESAASGGLSNLTVYFIIANNGGATGDLVHNNLSGFRIHNFRISSVGTEGFNADNIHNFSFDMAGNWDDAAVKTTLLFNPFTEL